MPAHDMTTAPMITCAGCKHSYADSALFCPNCGTPKARDAMPADPLIGKILGERFQVLEVIGQGGSGTIYRAEHVTLRRKVGIKVLHNELSRDDLAVERFRREATTVAEIDNEHIVEIHDFGRTPDGRLYLAMELLEGETLDHLLAREKTLSIERTADILIQVGEALMEAHAIGYVHRDLRPRNIYLAVRRGKANFVKLLDFGLAKLVESDSQAASTSLGMTFGDPRYMSPEQARGDRIDRRADIYQLGCVAYEMLTGSPPFTGNRVFDILSKQVTEVPAPLPTRRPGVPLWVEAAVAKMLAKDPENRFATTTRMVEALRRGLETGEVMEDEVARRRESIPPPSVSRVMQKMGLGAPVDTPVTNPAHTQIGAAPAPGIPAPGSAPVIGKETVRGHLEGPLPPLVAERRRTGTPQVGVPIASPPVGAHVAQPVVTGQIEPRVEMPVPPAPIPVAGPVSYGPPAMPAPASVAPSVVVAHPAPAAPFAPAAVAPSDAIPVAMPSRGSGPSTGAVRATPDAPIGPIEAASGRVKRGSSQLTESAAWFDEGESASEEADRVRGRKHVSPSTTDLSLYDDLPPRRRWPLVLAILGGLALVGGTIAFAVTRGGNEAAQPAAQPPAPVATAPISPVDVPPSQIISDAPAVGSAEEPAPAKPKQERPAQPTSSSSSSSSTPTSSARKTGGTTTSARTPSTDDGSPRRPGGGGWFDTPAAAPSPTVVSPPPTPTPTPTPQPSGVSGTDGPVDPYGGGDVTPSDGTSPEKKAEFFASLGKQQLAQGDAAGAAASFKKAIELDPRSITATIGMGEIALRQGLFGDAIHHLKKAIKLSPRSSLAYTLLGEAYLGTGNNAVAADNFKRALQLDPENARAREGFNDAQSRVPPPEDEP
jgi:tRNA A-37 threonylcarbamoyl transferase component Bud32